MVEISVTPRDYQKAIIETAKKANTLVVLPTGLGKTLIALMLSIHRLKEHPGKKVLMLAPTRPLIEQHVKSFKKEIPELWAQIELFTGSVSAKERKKLFQQADIVFSTPQCIANDLRQQLYTLHDCSLLIVDEAHRCLKNYAYNQVAQMYKMQSETPRLVGLTASPGSDPGVVKQICENLNIEEIELRSRDSPDVKEYLEDLEFKKVEVPFPKEFAEIRVLLKRIYNSKIEQLQSRGLIFGPINKITLLKTQAKLASQASPRNFQAMVGMSLTAQAIKITHAIELLETQTLAGLDEYLQGLVAQARQKKSKGVQTLVNSPDFQAALVSLSLLIQQKIEHPKIEELSVLVEEEFEESERPKIIVFTQFRDSAKAIVEKLNKNPKIRAAVFIGQAKKTNSRGTVMAGLNQKEQKKIVEDFREGKLNVIVATSIGEEGLDIPEVNAVVFYEPVPSAIRKIQRAGRTARLAPGKLFILVTKDTRDEIYHYASSAREKKMHKTITKIKEDIKNKPKTLNDYGWRSSRT